MNRCSEHDKIEIEEVYINGEPIKVVDYHCFQCGKYLFRASQGTDGLIFVYCRRCRDEVTVNVYTKRKIGF